MGPIAYCFLAAVWSITTFVPMFGDMGIGLPSSAYPLLSPVNNPVTRFFVGLYAWDRFITVAIVASICVVVWLAVLAYRSARPAQTTARPRRPEPELLATSTFGRLKPNRRSAAS
jgi:hypothetical protein